MDIVKLLQDLATTIASLQVQLADAQTALKAATDQAFADGAASRQVEVDGLNAQVVEKDAKIVELNAVIDDLKKNDPLKGQLDAALAKVQELQDKIAKAVADLG